MLIFILKANPFYLIKNLYNRLIMVIETRNRAFKLDFDTKSTIWYKFSLKIYLYPFNEYRVNSNLRQI